MTRIIEQESIIASELFPLRPSQEEPLPPGDRIAQRLEASTMIGLLERTVGKRPSGVRLALLANYENLVCFFYGDQVSHWQYISEISAHWPERWDIRAEIALGRIEEIEKPTPAKQEIDAILSNMIDQVDGMIGTVDATKQKLLTIGDGYATHKRGSRRKNLRQQTGGATSGHPPPDGAQASAGGDADAEDSGGVGLPV